MKQHKKSQTVRRSVALPRQLVEEVSTFFTPDRAKNRNRLVISALEEYAARHRRAQFEEAIAAMAADPSIQAETKRISKEFKKSGMGCD
jgi:metal-responsive CopG/Arc/MetJ family transcriptional regulator